VTATQGFELRGERTPLGELVVELWRSRSLISILARKEFFVRYRRASFGLFWAVGLPLFQAIVLAVVFSRIVKIETGTSYAAFVYSGMVAWSFFNGTLTAAATSIVDGANLTSRIYFPRAVLPLVSITANAYGFAVNAVVLVLLCLVSGVSIGPEIVMLVPAVALLLVLLAGFALVLSALHVYFRDVRYLVAAVTTAWFYVTPVLYPVRLAPGALRAVVKANPVTGIVELFRFATVGADPGWGTMVAVTGIWTAALVALGLALHCRFNRVFADLL
jgi:lipopolysaccharide transport system permease protein